MTVGGLGSSERPQDRSDVALFYAASSPTQVFNQAAQQVAQERVHSLSENARALALINIAMNDSLVASFLNKYHYNFWRPETAIHAGATDGNPKTESDSRSHVLKPDCSSVFRNRGTVKLRTSMERTTDVRGIMPRSETGRKSCIGGNKFFAGNPRHL